MKKVKNQKCFFDMFKAFFMSYLKVKNRGQRSLHI
jgi:hypothetical protein